MSSRALQGSSVARLRRNFARQLTFNRRIFLKMAPSHHSMPFSLHCLQPTVINIVLHHSEICHNLLFFGHVRSSVPRHVVGVEGQEPCIPTTSNLLHTRKMYKLQMASPQKNSDNHSDDLMFQFSSSVFSYDCSRCYPAKTSLLSFFRGTFGPWFL